MVTIRPFGEHVENIKSLEEGLQEYFKSVPLKYSII